jgi:hypothetical protein
MNLRRVFTATLAMLCLSQASPASGQTEREEKKIEFTNEQSLRAKIEFGAGTIDVHAGASDLIVDAVATYDSRSVDFLVDYDRRGQAGDLLLSSELRESRVRDKVKNDWTVGLTGKIPIDLEFDIGAAEAEIDLTGLQISELEMNVGAAKATVWCDRPNAEPLRDITIDCGASSLVMENLGNLNFDILRFDGGVGSFDLDFSGDWARSASADFEVGLGSLSITVPDDIGVRVETEDSFMSSMDVDREFEEVDDDIYETRNYESARVRLDIRIQLGMGSADVRVKPR